MDILLWQSKSISQATAAVERAIGAWTIASHLRIECDKGVYQDKGTSAGCTSKKSLDGGRELFRPRTDLEPEEKTAKPKPEGCVARSDKLEDTIDACLNLTCAKTASGAADMANCKMASQQGLLPLVNEHVLRSMSSMDADSIVFLTRAQLISKFLESHYKAPGHKIAAQD